MVTANYIKLIAAIKQLHRIMRFKKMSKLVIEPGFRGVGLKHNIIDIRTISNYTSESDPRSYEVT